MTLPPAPSRPRSYNVEDQERMTRAANYFAWQAKLVTPELGQRVVEVGCGTGNFTGALLDREAVIAVDVDADCIERLARRYRDRENLHSVVADAADLRPEQLLSYRPDSCVCLNVLEHIEDDRGTLQRIASILPSGGVIVLIVPAFESLYGPIDSNLGHWRRYSRKSFKKLAQASGLKIKKLRYMNFVGFFGWWLNAHVLHRDRQSEKQIEFFDRFIVPPLSLMEAIVAPPFGQSLFVVLEKP
jgi:SAM-dependent methyltransferase